MSTELRTRHQAQQLYVRALTTAWRNGVQLVDPSLWLMREPELEEKMMRDADIVHAVRYRQHLVAGRRWSCVARVEGSPRAPMAVAVATALCKRIQGFSQSRMLLASAFLSGARYGRIHGRPMTLTIGDGRPRTWWVPVRIEDQDKRWFRIVPTRDVRDGKTTAHWERWDLTTENWVTVTVDEARETIRHTYLDDQSSLGYGRGLREALAWWWYAKTNVFGETMQAVERFAQGILSAKIDGARDASTGKPNTQLVQDWTDVLTDLRSRHVLVYDAADTLEVVQPSGEGWQLLQAVRDELKATISTLILGANLTTQADSGGSYALAEVQENSTEALVQFDREALEERLSDDLLGCLWWKNWRNMVELGIADERPMFSLAQEKRQDPQQRAQVAQILNTMGVELALEDVLDQTGFRRPEPGETIVPKAAPQPVPGFGDPFGGAPDAGP